MLINQIVHCTLCQQCTPHHGLHRYGPVRSQHGYVDLGQQLSQKLFSSEGLCNNNKNCLSTGIVYFMSLCLIYALLYCPLFPKKIYENRKSVHNQNSVGIQASSAVVFYKNSINSIKMLTHLTTVVDHCFTSNVKRHNASVFVDNGVETVRFTDHFQNYSQ